MFTTPTVGGAWAYQKHYCALTLGKGAISVAFVHPFIRLSVAYIANNSRTRSPSVPKFWRKIPYLWCDSHTNFKVNRSKVKVIRPINAHAYRAPYLPNGKPTNFKLGVPMEDDDPHQPQAPWPPRSKVKVAGTRDPSEPSWPNDVPVSSEAGGGIPCRPHFLLLLVCKHSRS